MLNFIIIGEAISFLEQVCKHYPYQNHPNGKIQDSKGNTPYHLVMGRRKGPNNIKICEILSQYPINPNLSNNNGKKASDGRGQDKRYLIMQQAAKQFQTPKKRSRRKKRNRVNSAPASYSGNSSTNEVVEVNPAIESDSSHKPQVEDVFDIAVIMQDVNKMLNQLHDQPQSYFAPPPDYVRQRSRPHDVQTKAVLQEGANDPSLRGKKPPAITFKQSVKKVADVVSRSRILPGKLNVLIK